MSTFASFATTDDLVLALLKAMIFGAIVTVVSAQKGLSTKGGPTGVANWSTRPSSKRSWC